MSIRKQIVNRPHAWTPLQPNTRCPARILWVMLIMGSCFALACEEKKTPEQEIQELLDRGVAALEKNQLSEAVALLSDSYLDVSGRDQQKMKSLTFMLLRRGPVMVFMSDVQIKVNGVSASVQLKATAVQGKRKIAQLKDVIPQNARKMDITLQLLKEGDDWGITAIDGDGFGGSF